MWKPSPLRIGLGHARLGQQSTLTNRMAAAVVAEAEPRLRQVIAEERNRWADAILSGLPYAGLATAGILAATYAVPPDKPMVRLATYGGAALLAGIGIITVASALKEAVDAAPAAEPGGIVQDVISTFVDPASRQLAKDVVAEATPRVRQILDEERERAAAAAQAAIPWVGVSILSVLGTAFLVPGGMPLAKMGGYGASAAFAMIGLYQGVGVTR